MRTARARKPQPVVGSYIPRRLRSKLRGEAAFARGKAQGLTVLQSAEVMMAACAGEFWRVNQLKIGIENLIKRGPGAARSHYAEIAGFLSDDIDEALRALDRSRQSEIDHIRQIEVRALGGRHHNLRLNRFDRLTNARIVLRWMRATGRASLWPRLRAALISPLWNVISVSEDATFIQIEPNFVDGEFGS